jgi:hypothetical protein
VLKKIRTHRLSIGTSHCVSDMERILKELLGEVHAFEIMPVDVTVCICFEESQIGFGQHTKQTTHPMGQ